MQIENNTVDLSDYVATLIRRKWQFLIPVVLVFILAITVVVKLPTKYQSSAIILIEQQEIPVDLVRSTVTSYADQRVQVIRQRVMTTANLRQIIERHDLYPELRVDRGIASAVERIRRDIEIKMISADVVDPQSGRAGSATIAFSVAYSSQSPVMAQRVANDIVSLFLDENIRERRRTAEEASRFLEQESLKLAEQVSELEARLALFKEEHGDSVPEMMQVNLQLLQRTDDSIRQIDQELRSLETNQVFLQSELTKVNPYSAMYSSTGERILSPADRLRMLETEFLTYSSRYSSVHPDRLAIEREIDLLRQEVGRRDDRDIRRLLTEQQNELARLRSRYSSEHPDVTSLERQITETRARIAANAGAGFEPLEMTIGVGDADNPAFIQLQAQWNANQSKINSLRQTRADLEARLIDLETRISEAPKVEREYRLITRDHEGALERYAQVRRRHLEAALAESLESERKGERFTLIEPPLVPEQPYSPNRKLLALVGFVVAVGTGAGVLGVREALDDGVYSIQVVKEITGAPPLAIMPVIRTDADRRQTRYRRIAYGVVAFATIAGAAIAVDTFVRPLDVLWFQVLDSLTSLAQFPT
ncbi:Wzz/FepE/Etk N-terminal domain-containing protein [Thiocapsa imhoffii]|uniref:Wzz/FepE/Etk N-terminal domain-containing protein n=1 Tax=Thiocapsa imhoffii TaxID=382777 RepID=UPI0030B8800F